MAWIEPSHSKNRVDWAGNVLISTSPTKLADIPVRTEAFQVINNWRASHAYPLHSVAMTLRQRAPRVDDKAVIAQRLKRLVSIRSKLNRFQEWLKLSRMQDIGGCRAVLQTVRQVEELHSIYRDGGTTSELRRVDDYIVEPKGDGYRGIHYVYRYKSTTPKYRIFDGQQIEVQLRSLLQHVWATANETVSTFTGQRLKAGRGREDWLRFFTLMGAAFAIREGRTPVPDVTEDIPALLEELQELISSLEVPLILGGWQAAMHTIQNEAPKDAKVFLLELDPDARRLTITPFPREDIAKASESYLNAEREVENHPHKDAVLVKGASIDVLRSAYPNYYVDLEKFLYAVQRIQAGEIDPEREAVR